MKNILILFANLLVSSCALQEELLSAEEAVRILKKHNVVLAMVSSVPSGYEQKLTTAQRLYGRKGRL